MQSLNIAIDRVMKLILIFLSVFLVLTGIMSLLWHFEHDTPIMLYIAFLMDRFGYIPYREIFDMNMVGTYQVYYLIGKLFGYTNIGIRFADLVFLTTILIVNWLWMRMISRRAAWAGSVVWGLLYLGFGSTMDLQREYLILLPILIAVFIFSCEPKKPIFRNLAVGFFFGLAATIKPHAAIGLFPLLFFNFLTNVRNRNSPDSAAVKPFKQTLLPIIIGFSFPFLIALFYLWFSGAVKAFLDIATNYWPLYTHLGGDLIARSGFSRIEYLFLNHIRLGGFAIWLVPASIGSYVALYQLEQKRVLKDQIFILIGLTVSYSIYPIFAGQFWTYHWIPFSFFVIQLSSLCLIEQSENVAIGKRVFPIVILIFVVAAYQPIGIYKAFLTGQKLLPPEEGRVEEIVTFLKPRLQNGDTVQPLDWTGGAVHAMLILKARVATPFIYDFYFYHDISNEYIKGLRGSFLADLRKSRPRFIINVIGEFKPWPKGVDTTREFKELQLLLDEYYIKVFEGDGYQIYELRRTGNNNRFSESFLAL